MTYPQDTLREWIERCLDESPDLTKWEQGFLESIEDALTRTGHLSESQIEILERIYTEKVP